MNHLIEAIKAWPVIVQGALGSALFWLVLIIGERTKKCVALKYSHYSRKSRLSWLINEQTKLEAALAKSVDDRAHRVLFLLYRASRPFLKALMWAIYGLVMDSMFNPAGLIGYIVSLLFLFKTYEILGPIDIDANLDDKLKGITEEINSLEA